MSVVLVGFGVVFGVCCVFEWGVYQQPPPSFNPPIVSCMCAYVGRFPLSFLALLRTHQVEGEEGGEVVDERDGQVRHDRLVLL